MTQHAPAATTSAPQPLPTSERPPGMASMPHLPINQLTHVSIAHFAPLLPTGAHQPLPCQHGTCMDYSGSSGYLALLCLALGHDALSLTHCAEPPIWES